MVSREFANVSVKVLLNIFEAFFIYRNDLGIHYEKKVTTTIFITLATIS